MKILLICGDRNWTNWKVLYKAILKKKLEMKNLIAL